MVATKLKVVGMCCSRCVVAVDKALGKIPSVRQVDVDLESGLVTIRGKAKENPEILIEAIKEVRNYQVSLIGQSKSISVGL